MALRITRRNLAARSPLMRKGGAHERGKHAQRQDHRRELADALDEWREQTIDSRHTQEPRDD